jgi:hypothetical protein
MPYVSLCDGADASVLPDEWLAMTEEMLRRDAASHRYACDDGDLDPHALEWRLVIDLPLAVLIPLMGAHRGWVSWFEDELAMLDGDLPHVAEGYRALMEEPLENPIIVTIEPRRVQIWDGWHRTATRIMGRAVTIPAIVGRLPEGPHLAELVGRRALVPAA